LILDDDSLLRKGVRTIIERSKQPFYVAYEASSVPIALQWLAINTCDIAVVDMNMPVHSGLDFFVELERINHQIKCIVLSGHEDFKYTSGSIRFGVIDYLLKPTTRDVLMEALIKADKKISQDEAIQNAIISRMEAEGDKGLFQNTDYKIWFDRLETLFNLIHNSVEEVRQQQLNALIESFSDSKISDGSKQRHMQFFHQYTLDRVEELFPQFYSENQKEANKLTIYAQSNDYNVYLEHYKAYWNHIYSYADTVRKRGAYRDIDSALAYIHENYKKDINMASVSNFLNIDYSNFSKKFKMVTGGNFSEYIKNLRIESAKNLLSDTNETIAQIANNLSFGNTKHFITTFKKTVGVTPTEYRRLYGGGN